MIVPPLDRLGPVSAGMVPPILPIQVGAPIRPSTPHIRLLSKDPCIAA